MRDKELKALSFEEAMQQLEEIVGSLEGGEVPLEEMVRLYERGIALKAHCEAKLKDAQSRVEKIVLDAQGNPTGTTLFTQNHEDE